MYQIPTVNGKHTGIYMSIDGRNLIHFFKLRLDIQAQWEIRKLAEEMYRLVKQIAPTMFDEKFKEYWL